MTVFNKSDLNLQILQPSLFNALYQFELENKAWFESTIGPRPDRYFEPEVFEKFQTNLIKEATNHQGFYYLACLNGQVIARINLYNLQGSMAELGYRIAQSQTGKGIGTYLISEITRIAKVGGIQTLYAHVKPDNPASSAILLKNHFSFREIKDGFNRFELLL